VKRKKYTIDLLDTSKLNRKNFRKSLQVLILVSGIAFALMLLIFRGSIRKISDDPSVVIINNETAFKVVQIININKNKFADRLATCWNMKNPYIGCNEKNKIVPGSYILKNGEDISWIDGPYKGIITSDPFVMSEINIRNFLHGFMRSDLTYYQTIQISYPENEDKMKIEIQTINSDGDTSNQILEISKN